MVSSQKQTQDVPHEQGTDILPAIREMLIQDPRIGRVEAQPERYGSSARIDDRSRKNFHPAPSITPAEPSLDPNPQQASLQKDRISNDKPSVGWRVFLTVARGFIVIAMVGAAFALLSYGDDKQRDLVRARDLSLNWLSSVLRSDSYQGSDGAAEPVSKPSGQTPSPSTTLPPGAPSIQSAQAPAATESSPDLQHQFETMASDVAVVRRLIEQLSARDDQMARDIATMQAAEQNVSQKLLSLPQSPTVRIPRKKVRAAHR
jgi:hypothetical protein